MKRYVALLRGINISGKNKVPIPDSRKRDDEFSPHLAEPPEFY